MKNNDGFEKVRTVLLFYNIATPFDVWLNKEQLDSFTCFCTQAAEKYVD